MSKKKHLPRGPLEPETIESDTTQVELIDLVILDELLL